MGVTRAEGKKARLVFVVGAIALALIFPLLALISDAYAPSGVQVNEQGIFGESSTDFEENSVAVYVQMLGFDPETERAELAFYPWPTDDLAKQFSSSVLTEKDIRLFVDSQDAELTEFSAGDQVGGVEVVADVLSTDFPDLASDSLYPFDQYVLDSYARVETRESELQEYSTIQTFDYFYTSPVPGFDVTYQRLAAFESAYPAESESSDPFRIAAERADGKISFYAFIERSFAVKAIAIFVYSFILIATLALVWVTSQMALGIRPPSMESLIWAAASMLGILELRALAPGDPRIGVLADLFIFFPSLILSLASVAGITYLWNTRKNFES
ncbi:DUF4436 family protein [Aquiluna borgnonia]|uniref:DUF4436 family protein n=1 Tax=Aquiluna borgnonia TaxID=2499157 RepID=A0A7D4PZC3_9MICO|nr:DUF4436 family protein [Aquiluna borgnonia]QKJ25605.1 DUF4436 family protein [Aquiluna borgnonia]